jgi:simple sugar transport system substrate-binding protein
MRNRRLMIGFAVLALVLAACGNEEASPAGSGGGTASRDMTIEVVTHGQASDPFWSVVKNGVDRGHRPASRSTTPRRPSDMVAMAAFDDTAVAASPDGS